MQRGIGSPVIIINFKNYPEAQGDGALRISRAAERASAATGVSVAVAPPQITVMHVARSVPVPTLAQHVDDVEPSSTTGFVPPESVAASGAAGGIINHSEHRLPEDVVGRLVERMRRLGLATVVCASTPEEAARLARFGPDYVAIEPPELIGTGRAVSRVAPDVVRRGVEAVRSVAPDVAVLCGAGVTDGDDVRAAAALGAMGVLVSSAVVRARDPGAKIEELARGIL
ncbi:MAG: triose-phosphate isomerase [Nitrososphaeria archaeon]|jgi:triosephosphate isomerase